MVEIATLSIGIGLIISLGFAELFGLAAGGMVVPGYFALFLDQPFVIILTLLISYLTYFIVHSMSSVIIIYGRRRTALMILIGFALGALIRSFSPMQLSTGTVDLTLVGHIIPGLIAIWVDRQGLIESFSTLVIASIIVRLILIIIFGQEIKL